MHQPGRLVTHQGYIWELLGEDDGNLPSDSPESPWAKYLAYQPPGVIPAWTRPQSRFGYSEGQYVRHGQGAERFIYMSRLPSNRHEPGVYGWMEVESFTGPPGNRSELTIPGGAVASLRPDEAKPPPGPARRSRGLAGPVAGPAIDVLGQTEAALR